jgi:hypothetical protein
VKQKQLSFRVGPLVQVQSLAEARCLKEADEAEFRAVTAGVKRERLLKTLAKAGLGLNENQITIRDTQKSIAPGRECPVPQTQLNQGMITVMT